MNEPVLTLGNRLIGTGHPTFVIAELSANHNGSLLVAMETLEAAAAAGADAVKVQTYTADSLTIDAPQDHFRIKSTIWDGRTLYSLYQEAAMPWEWFRPLSERANQLGITFFSTPFDEKAVEFLESEKVPIFKIASFEIVDLPLIQRTARSGKPMILSTGMASLEEISEAVECARSAGCSEIALLHCSSAYPAPAGEFHLRTIPELKEKFGVVSGLSDHTLGDTIAIAAVSIGGSIVEKHFILDRNQGGPDSQFSMQPEEFGQMVKSIRSVEAAMGKPSYGPSPSEEPSTKFRRSLHVVEDIPKGHRLTASNIRSIRPAGGLPPKFFPRILGCQALRDLQRGEPLREEDFDSGTEMESR